MGDLDLSKAKPIFKMHKPEDHIRVAQEYLDQLGSVVFQDPGMLVLVAHAHAALATAKLELRRQMQGEKDANTG